MIEIIFNPAADFYTTEYQSGDSTMKPHYIAALLTAWAIAMPASAQTVHHQSDRHSAQTSTLTPAEPGQGAYAAISEIVDLLQSNPETDWTRVDITALRDHLVDMHDLVIHTASRETMVPGGLEIRLDKANAFNAAALRMVRAHAPVLETETGWSSQIRKDETDVIWTVTSGREADIIRAFGFFGLMAVGDHHREHHLSIARGEMAH